MPRPQRPLDVRGLERQRIYFQIRNFPIRSVHCLQRPESINTTADPENCLNHKIFIFIQCTCWLFQFLYWYPNKDKSQLQNSLAFKNFDIAGIFSFLYCKKQHNSTILCILKSPHMQVPFSIQGIKKVQLKNIQYSDIQSMYSLVPSFSLHRTRNNTSTNKLLFVSKALFWDRYQISKNPTPLNSTNKVDFAPWLEGLLTFIQNKKSLNFLNVNA